MEWMLEVNPVRAGRFHHPTRSVLSVENASAAVFFTSVPPFPLLADLAQEHWYRGSGEMRKLTSLSGPSPEVLAATAGGLALSLRGWWGEINESPAWQDGAFFSLSAAYAFVSAVALIQFIRIQSRLPEFGWTVQKVFHLMNFIVNGVRAILFGFHVHVFLLRTKVYTLVLLDLPGLLFFSTYTLLVLFWAEIYHQAKSLPTDKLKVTYITINSVIYVIQVCIWLFLGINDNPPVELVSKVFIAVVSFIALLGFLIYGRRLFSMLRQCPIGSPGRRKKLYEIKEIWQG